MSESSVEAFLKKINDGSSETINVFLPSKGKAIKVKVLNLKQQKEIISSAADGVVGAISFTRILNEILTQSVDDTELKLYDKVPLAIALRANALGSNYIDGDRKINLNTIIERLNTYNHSIDDERMVTHNKIEVKLGIPTLAQESAAVKKLEEEIKRNGSDNHTKNLGSIYLYEIIKYIKQVSFDDIVLDYINLKTQEKIDIIEILPLSLNKKIIDYIEEVRAAEREILTVDDIVVEIDIDFFDVE